MAASTQDARDRLIEKAEVALHAAQLLERDVKELRDAADAASPNRGDVFDEVWYGLGAQVRQAQELATAMLETHRKVVRAIEEGDRVRRELRGEG